MTAAELLTADPAALEPGWYENVPMETYLRIPALSASGIEHLRRSPAHFRYYRDNPSEPSQAMKEGTALHLALLEPDLFHGRYVSLGRCEGRKKDGGECQYQGSVLRDGQSFCGTHDPLKDPENKADPGIQIMPAEALGRIERMRDAVLSHPDASQFFRGRGRSELTGIWRDEETGVLCKIRIDRLVDRVSEIHADVKTCADASPNAFRRTAGRFGYHRKTVFYRMGMKALGLKPNASVLIAVESLPPHGCATYLFDEEQLRQVQLEVRRAIRVYHECLESGEWPAYPAGLRHLEIAPWDMPEGASKYEGDPDWAADEAA